METVIPIWQLIVKTGVCFSDLRQMTHLQEQTLVANLSTALPVPRYNL